MKSLVIDPKQQAESLKQKYSDVFSPDLGKMKGAKIKLHLKENVSPKFVKARPPAYSMKMKIEKGLEELVADNVLEKVDHSEWATPIVAVPKTKW